MTRQACPALVASRSAWRSFGARAASSAVVSLTYLQAVAVLIPNPAASSANVFAQVGQDQQGPPARVQLAPRRAGPLAVAPDDPGGVIQGLAGQRQRGRIEKHGSPR